ncbi:Kiwa anti-phage protein KwaB-like domain-containing protein [Gimesia chilikensis]|uniref:Kiwa anti-phage protein KwaB-like domain-containing protein n=1 Tax=Gimesia chilikensis TaxID=2605989 RepID=UPI003A951F4E
MTKEPFQFFAITRTTDLALGLERIVLSQDVQQDLSIIFAEQANELIGDKVSTLPFSPTYTPQHKETVSIENFPLPELLKKALQTPQCLPELKFPFSEKAPIVKALLAVDSTNTLFYFQYFDSSKILKKRLTFLYNSNMFRKLDDPGITIDNHLTAIISDGNLYFRSFYRVRQFLDLDSFFKEATNSDLVEILTHEKLSVDNSDEIIKSLSSQMRKKFSIVMSTGILDDERVTPRKIQNRAKKFDGLDIKLTGKSGNQKVIFPTAPKTMGIFLRFLAEEFYISQLTDEPRETNSSRPLD